MMSRFPAEQSLFDVPPFGSSEKPGTSVLSRAVVGGPLRAVLLSVLLLIAAGGDAVEAKDKIRIGAVENVVLLPWGVQLPARIDTGAAVSSLDARNLVVKGQTVEFNLPPQYGGRAISLPIVKWKTVKSATAKTRRPVVVLEMCIGNRRIRTQVNLVDRSNVKYPLLIGRNTLMRDFVVECDTSFCTKPSCPEVLPK
ncbi:MAG: RimK/LysX family protein [Deltaproteobacteria bacterium]|nr:RimK/LysX family protein [Deltaproteobacteria bacterium]